MKTRSASLSQLAAVVAAALVLGSVGTAVAGPALTKGRVRSIAAKVVKKQAPSLSVATASTAGNASRLGGQPPSAYLDGSSVYYVTIAVAQASRSITVPLSPGSYQIGYSAYLAGGTGNSYCTIYRVRGTALFATATESATGTDQEMSAVGVVDVRAGDIVRLTCESATAWRTEDPAAHPIQIVVTPLDSVTIGTLTAS